MTPLREIRDFGPLVPGQVVDLPLRRSPSSADPHVGHIRSGLAFDQSAALAEHSRL